MGENGRVLLHCHHVGDNGSPSCRADAIVGALGLRLEDLFPPKSNGTVLGKIAAGLGASASDLGTKPHAGSETSGKTWKTLESALEWGRSKLKALNVSS